MAAVSEDGWFVGIDLGGRKSNHCFLDARGQIVAEGTVATTQEELGALFSSIPKFRAGLSRRSDSHQCLRAVGPPEYRFMTRKRGHW
jgi:hypothetical protein